jgi:hypothetical protein
VVGLTGFGERAWVSDGVSNLGAWPGGAVGDLRGGPPVRQAHLGQADRLAEAVAQRLGAPEQAQQGKRGSVGESQALPRWLHQSGAAQPSQRGSPHREA